MYSFNSKIRYTEADKYKKLTATGLINYFQDCSNLHSESVGAGMEALERVHRGWVLSAWQIVIKRMPDVFDEVRISTWPYAFEKFFGYRNFLMESSDGELLACANSVWVFLNTDTGRPSPPVEQIQGAYEMRPKSGHMQYEGRKIAVPEMMKAEEAFPVRRYHLDTYNHVNNGQYIQMAQEYVPEDFQIGQIRAEYKISALYNDMVYPYVHAEGSGKVTVELRNESGKTYTLVEFVE